MTKEQFIAFVKAKAPYIIAAVLILAAAGFATWKYVDQKNEHGHHAGQNYPENLFVTSLDFLQAGGAGSPSNQTLSMHFSQPVEAEKMKDFFQVSPNINGRFDRGQLPTEVLFTTDIPFEGGLDYAVTIKAGLPSTIGSQLREDFTKTLSVRFSADDFKILKHDKYSLLQSVSQYESNSLRAQVGSNIKNPSVKIFKAKNADIALEDLAEYSSTPYGQNPKINTDTSKLESLATLENISHGTEIPLPNAPGMYLIQALKENAAHSQVWVTVNTFGVHFRQDDQGFIAAIQDLKTGEPVNGAELKTYEVQDQTLKARQTLALSGIGRFPLAYPNKIDIIVAKKGNEYAIVPVSLNGSLAELSVYQNLNDAWQGFLYTERPIYKPTDTIKFRGLIRKDNDGIYQLPPAGSKVQVVINSENYEQNKNIPEQTVTINEHGVYFGEFNVNALPAGKYFATASLTGETTNNYSASQAWFEVLEYKKPEFDLNASVAKDEYIEGDTVTATFKGTNFNGRAFGKQKATVKVYSLDYYETEKAVYNKSFALNGWGGMCGGSGNPYETYYGEQIATEEITTGDNGEYKLNFDTKKLTKNISQMVTFVVEKQDGKGNTISGVKPVVVHNGDINIFVRPFKNQEKNAAAPVAVFSVESLDGTPMGNRTFDYSIDQVRYTYDYQKNTNERVMKPLRTGTVKNGSDGIGQFTVEGLKDMESGFDSIEVNVRTKDSRGNTVTGSQALYVYSGYYQYELPTLLSITSNKNNLVPGEKAQMKINAPAAMKVLLAFERGRLYDAQWLDLKAGENTYEFTVKDEYAPTITPTFTAFYKNQYFSEGLTFNVPAMNKLTTLTVTTDKQDYNQGQVAKITVKATNKDGQPVQTNLSVGIIDKAIYALRKSTQLPLHSSFYFFRPRRTNNSSSMTGISYGQGAERGGGGGDLTSLYGRDVDVLYWNPDINTDANGEATILVPVSGNTVWKGVIYSSSDTTDLGQTDFEFSTH